MWLKIRRIDFNFCFGTGLAYRYANTKNTKNKNQKLKPRTMRNKLIFTAILSLFFTSSVFTTTDHSNILDVDLKQEKVMKTINYNGEIIPYVELPELVVTGKFNRDILVKATLIDGKAYPSYELDEVVINVN